MSDIVKDLKQIKEKVLMGTATAQDADKINEIIRAIEKPQTVSDVMPTQEELFLPDQIPNSITIRAEYVTINYFRDDNPPTSD